MQLEQHLDGLRRAVEAFSRFRDDGGARGRRSHHS